MVDPQSEALRGRHLLIVEDEYMIAAELARALQDRGANVIGPAGSVEDALQLLEAERQIDGAVLDINLGGERAYPVADALRARAVPFVFATGYDAWVIPETYASVPRMEKPVNMPSLARLLSKD
ncbi:response regulator [Bradyrhizobium sp. I1.7.5]|uniref:response regulator n=1 Tax=Bradyrhizobium sp. I1.7.5 TaxID=3156363 RepID=UPI003391BCB2